MERVGEADVGEADDAVRILVVDDDEKNLRAVSALLAELPAELVLARSGDEALRILLRDDDVAVILLDIRMPGLGGFETAELIRSRERTRRTPIIFLTAHARSDVDLVRGYRLGAVDFLVKPVLPEEVLRDKVGWFVAAHRSALVLERERGRARAAERRAHERELAEARERCEAEALRTEMERREVLSERLERAHERLGVLAALTADLVLAPAPAEVLPRHLAALSTLLGLEVHLLHLVAPGGALAPAVHAGVDAEALGRLAAIPPEATLFGAAAARRRPIVRVRVRDGDGGQADEASTRDLAALGLAAAVCQPLAVDGRLVGTLTLGTRSARPLAGDELDLLGPTADQMAMALDRARLIDELRRRARELAEIDQRKDEFLAMLGHELRNPLAPILNGVEILTRPGAPEEARRRALEAAGRQVRHLVHLVDDLVDVSRIRTGKIELRRERVELARVIQDAVTAVDPVLRRQGQELSLEVPDEPLVLDADPVRLTQVVGNLLHNAAKYTDPGGHVRLAVRRAGAELVVRVEDDGIGIPAELLPRVFDVFVQGKQPPHRARGGLGLGLALVKSLVELHGGRVRAESAGAGQGSAFELRLPAAPGATRAEAASQPLPRGAPLRIAVIEDNKDVRDTLRELLLTCGHEVVEAEDGHGAIELVLGGAADVALVDIGLPGLDGYEVASRVRGRTRTRLVALTGYGCDEDRSRAATAGFDAHLVKPVELDDLTRVLDRVAGPTPALPGEAPCPTPP
jgi:signal transduction histidine kinase/DNA-binding response OmpR family regulator